MANGFKTGGRQKGTPNKVTAAVMAAATSKIEVLGAPVHARTALELVQAVYRNPDLPLQIRLFAANIAIDREPSPHQEAGAVKPMLSIADITAMGRRGHAEPVEDTTPNLALLLADALKPQAAPPLLIEGTPLSADDDAWIREQIALDKKHGVDRDR